MTALIKYCLNAGRRYRIFVWRAMRDRKTRPERDFSYWQNNLFVFIMSRIMPVAVLVALLVSYYEWRMGDGHLVFANACALFLINLSVLQRKLSMFFRKLLFAVIMVGLSITMAGFLHNPELGSIYLFTASIFMVLFLSGNISYAGVILNILVCLLFSLYLYSSPEACLAYNISMYKWIVFSANFLFIDIVVVLLIRLLLASIERSFNAQKQLNRQLISEANLKQEQHRRLREIAFIQSHLVRAPLLNIKGISHLIINSHNHNIEPILLVNLEKSVEELDGIIKSVVEHTSL
jgi:hypothetical protein